MPASAAIATPVRSLAYPLASSTVPGGLVIADRGFWSVEFAHVLTATGANLLVRLQPNRLGTAWEELADGSYVKATALAVAAPCG
ncbi:MULTISPECIES: hypothetical protein [Streptomyces]|uniref:hypothetical protein n=1 Tax=Streptomyces TaxID=1883 RepID=UPI00081B23D5|nr:MULTISPECIES: hypothetical protein [unclassified Streptomyces]MYQ50509.1 hypothetical protein [Streptomyces sp. SID4941]SCD41745.1 hypothetical protein GA0115247_104235 [Streptomyces sp. PalvLS-984]SDC57437.1 hypothetical protein F558DRAFT_02167 [Streptomyces sp. AmelKG-A3]